MARIRAQELAAAAARRTDAGDASDEEPSPAVSKSKRRTSEKSGLGSPSAGGDVSTDVATEPLSGKKLKGSKLKTTAVIIEPDTAAVSGKSNASAPMAILASSEGFVATPVVGWWGASRFVSSGCLAGMERTAEHTAKERKAFSESTQEELYMAVHGAKTTGKKGVGKGIGGGAFCPSV